MRRGALISIPSLPVEFIEGGSATLSPGKEHWVTAAAKLTLAKSARLGDRLKVVNSAEVSLTISGSAIGGVDNLGNRYADQSSVRLPAGGEADFVRSRRGWRARGCDRAVLTFAYNGVPLADNASNPLAAGGYVHYLGRLGNSGNWVNPTGTRLGVAASALEAGSLANLTDRVAAGQNVATTNASNSWIAFQFPKQFRCTGFWFQTRSADNNHFPRAFEIRVATGSSLGAINPLSWPIAQSWANRAEITQQNTHYYYPVSASLRGNQLAYTQPTNSNSSGTNYIVIQEFEFFGDEE